MSLEPNIEETRRLLEKLRRRVEGGVKQETLKTEVLEGLTRALEGLDGTNGGDPLASHRGLQRTLHARSRSNQAMISATDEMRYLREVCRIVVEDCGHAMVWIGYAEPDAGKTVRPVVYSGFEKGYLETLNITWADTERGRGPTGTAIRRGKPCVCADMQRDPKFLPWREEALKRGYASSAVLPLMDEGRAFGAISIYAREPDAFSPEEVALLSDLAQDLSFGVQSIRMRQAQARSEELLQRSEERFRSIVELSPDAIFVNHNGLISYVNPAGLELFGATEPGQILGRSPFDLFHPEYHPKMRERIAMLFDGGSVPLTEARIVRLDGTFRDVESAASRHDVQEGRAIQVVLRDVTERRQAQEMLARSLVETQQRAGETEAVLAAMDDAVLVYDQDMNVLRANPGFIPVYGFDPAGLNLREVMQRTKCHCADGRSVPLEEQPTPRALRGEAVLNQHFRITRMDGQERALETSATPLRAGGRIVGAVTVWHDVTERRRAEESLACERANLQAVFDAANFGMLLLDAQGNVARTNATLARWLGKDLHAHGHRQPGDLVGCIHALSDPAGCGRTERCGACTIRSAFTAALRSGKPVHHVETELTLLLDGSRVSLCFEVSADPVVLDGHPHVLLGMSDITERKRAEEALRQSREDLNRAQAVAHTGSWRLDVRRNELIWSDENWRIFGVPQGTPLTYETFLGTVHPDDRAHVDERWSAALRGEPYDIEHRIVIGDTVKWVRERAELEFDGDGQLLGGFGTTEDITDRKRAAETLKESEERFRTLFVSMNEGYYLAEVIYDDSGMPCDLRFLVANPAFEQIMGRGKEEIIGRRVTELIPNPSSPWMQVFVEVALTGTPQECVFHSETLRRDFESFIFSPAKGHVAVLVADITERRRAEEALRSSEQRERERAEELAVLFEAVPMPVFIARDPDCAHMTGNRLADEILRIDHGHELSMSASGEDRPRHFRTFKDGRELALDELPAQRAARGAHVKDFEFSIVFDDGVVRHLLGYGTPLLDGDSRARGAVATLVDITERRQLEDVQAFLGQTGAGPQNAPFFDELARYLAQSLGMDFVCIDRLEGDGLTARTVSVWCDGRFEDNVTYALKDTPCGDVVGKTVCCFPASVCQFFPRDQVLQDLRAESYVGVTLWGHTGLPIGLIAVIGRNPLANRAQAETVLKLVSARAAAEMERSEAERALRENEATLRGVLDATKESIWLFGPDGVMLMGNKTAFSRFGKQPQEVVGRHFNEILPAELAQSRLARLNECVASRNPVEFEDERAGIHFRHDFYPVLDADGRVAAVAGFSMDITQSRRAEEALRESEDRYRSLFNGMTEGFALHEIVLDESGRPCDYRFLDINPSFERLTGLKRDDVVGRLMREVLPDDDPAWITVYGRVALTGEPVHFENYSPAIQRWYEVFSYRPAPGQFAVLFLDVTDRRQAQEALAKREEGLRQALRLGRSFTFEWCVATDEVVSGEECADILGLSGDAVAHDTGAAYFSRVYPDDLGALEQALHGLTPEDDTYTMVYRVIRPDGTVVCLEEIARAFFDAQGNMERLAGIAADVTERVRAQEALRQSHEALERRVDERTAELRAMNEALQTEMEARQRARETASRLAAIVSSSDDAILSKTPDGVILTWNKGAERLFGYSEAEVVGRHVAFLTPEDRSDETRRILERIQRGERIERFETVRQGRDGRRVNVSLTISPIHDRAGTVVAASEIAHDITERKRMEDELRQASEYARSLIEASLDPLVTIGLSGSITDVNEAMERMTGVARRQMIGSDFSRYFTEPEKAAEGFERVLADGTVTDFPLTVHHCLGGTTDVLYNATVYRNTAGEVQGVFAAARDITQRKQAEEELARYRDHLEDLVRQRTAQLETAYRDLQEDIAARERLEAERMRLMDILEATSDMVSYSDASGRVLYFNRSARRILGIPLGGELSEYVIPKGHPDWAGRILQEIALPTAVLEGIWSGETAVLDAGGNEIPVSQVIVAHKDASGQVAHFSTIARDMTAQKLAERELKALASFPGENPSPVLRASEDGLLVYANETAEPLLRAWGCAVGDPLPRGIMKLFSRALKRGKIQEAEYEAEGRVYSVLFAPVRETGHVNLYGRDITERRRMEDALVQARDELERRVENRTAELFQANVALMDKIEEHTRTLEALRTSQTRLAEAQRIAHLGGWEWDIRSGALTWSDEVFRILGRNPQEQAPTFPEFVSWLPAEDRKLVAKTTLNAVVEKAPFSLEHRILLPDGEIRHVHAQAEMILDEAGMPARMVGTILDITSHVRAEEEARLRQQQLIQADKMVSLGILVAGVAHEINNPNHSIMSNVTALAAVWENTRPILDRFYEDFGDFVLGGFDYSECRDKLPDMFTNALSNSKRIEVIVTELRDFARQSPRESMADVDVNAVVRSAIILMGNMVKKCTDHFSAAYAADLPPVLGNFQRIEQVVINLVQNACQALDSRDKLVHVLTSYDPSTRLVLIVVCDEGVGIPEENLKQLGTPFFTTKRGSEGMGLGLWISSNIAHEHGGTLTFSAREGGGTRAVLALPASAPPAENAPMEHPS